MYNVYTAQKRKEEDEMKKRNEMLMKRRKVKHKKQLTQLAEKYEQRIRGFLYEMVKKPIYIRDIKTKNTSTRQDLLFEESDKILFKKGFVFSNVNHRSPSECKRSNKCLYKRNKCNDLSPQPCVIGECKYHTQCVNSDGNYIQQPVMRFKHRTDLERIHEALMQISPYANENTKMFIENQLNELGIGKMTIARKNECDSGSDNNNNNNVNDIDDKYSFPKCKDGINSDSGNNMFKKVKIKQSSSFNNNNNHSKQKTIPRINNSNAKKIHSDLYNKTYFKAVENYSLFQNSFFIPEHRILYKQTSSPYHQTHKNDNYKNCKKNFSELQLKRHSKVKTRNIKPIITTTDNISKTVSSFRNNDYQLQTQDTSSPVELVKMLNDNYISRKEKEMNLMKSLDHVNLLTQPLTSNKENKKDINYNNMFEQVKQLAFPQKRMKSYGDIYYGKESNIKEEEKIIMDGVVYYKKDLGKLSTKILEKCNWRHHKYLNKNNHSSKGNNDENMDNLYYKSGKGKLMFTKGMTISEFEQKYNL